MELELPIFLLCDYLLSYSFSLRHAFAELELKKKERNEQVTRVCFNYLKSEHLFVLQLLFVFVLCYSFCFIAVRCRSGDSGSTETETKTETKLAAATCYNRICRLAKGDVAEREEVVVVVQASLV